MVATGCLNGPEVPPADERLPLDRFLPFRLSHASNLVSELVANAYKSLFGLSIPEWRVIMIVAEADAITQRDIAARTRMDKVTVSRAAIALTRRELISRRPDERDGRARLLALSPSGRDLYKQVIPKAKELERRVFGRFDPETLADLDRLLRTIDIFAADELTRLSRD